MTKKEQEVFVVLILYALFAGLGVALIQHHQLFG